MKMNYLKTVSLAVISWAILAAAGCEGCGSRIPGKYTDPTGAISLDLKSGGDSIFTFAGQTESCSYSTNGKQVSVRCKGDVNNTVFNVRDDGALVGPPGSLVPTLTKK
jgi:hypothetical protein